MTTPHAELKRLAEAATPGPWSAEWSDLEYDALGQEGWVVDAQVGSVCVPDGPLGQREHDARFIAAARQAVPALIEENERKGAVIIELGNALRQSGVELDAISAAIGTVRYMDPPDGGDVSLAEQVRRMREENERMRGTLTEISALPKMSENPVDDFDWGARATHLDAADLALKALRSQQKGEG